MNKKISAVVLILIIFGLGILTGFTGFRFLTQRNMRQMALLERPPLKEFFMKRIAGNLDLTESQQAAIDPIVLKTEAELYLFLDDAKIEFAGIMSKMTSEKKKPLTPSQQKIISENFNRFLELWHIPRQGK